MEMKVVKPAENKEKLDLSMAKELKRNNNFSPKSSLEEIIVLQINPRFGSQMENKNTAKANVKAKIIFLLD